MDITKSNRKYKPEEAVQILQETQAAQPTDGKVQKIRIGDMLTFLHQNGFLEEKVGKSGNSFLVPTSKAAATGICWDEWPETERHSIMLLGPAGLDYLLEHRAELPGLFDREKISHLEGKYVLMWRDNKGNLRYYKQPTPKNNFFSSLYLTDAQGFDDESAAHKVMEKQNILSGTPLIIQVRNGDAEHTYRQLTETAWAEEKTLEEVVQILQEAQADQPTDEKPPKINKWDVCAFLRQNGFMREKEGKSGNSFLVTTSKAMVNGICRQEWRESERHAITLFSPAGLNYLLKHKDKLPGLNRKEFAVKKAEKNLLDLEGKYVIMWTARNGQLYYYKQPTAADNFLTTFYLNTAQGFDDIAAAQKEIDLKKLQNNSPLIVQVKDGDAERAYWQQKSKKS